MEDYSLRNLSVTNDNWLGDIPQDRPTLVIAEGLLMYLQPEQSKKVITDVVNYFGHGGQVIFDTLGTILQKYTSQVQWLKSSGAAFTWGVDDPREIELLHPELKLLDREYWYQYMHVERKVSCAPPWFGKNITKAAAILPSFNDFGQVMRFQFRSGESS
jgi:O-methyltransferase involved in polyketide biosynthesis